jgi:signal transduction histidine kinase
VIVLAGYVNFALKLNLFFFALNPFLQFYGVYQSKHIPSKIQKILLSGYAIYIAIVSLGLMMVFGFNTPFQDSAIFRQVADWRLNGASIGIVIFWVVFTEQASREALKASELIALRMEAAQAKANEEKLTDRHTLIDILTHELKNPLGTIKFALASLRRNVVNDDDSSRRFKHIDLCVGRMNALIEHVARSSKIDRFTSFDQKEQIFAIDLLSELIDEYPEFERFN